MLTLYLIWPIFGIFPYELVMELEKGKDHGRKKYLNTGETAEILNTSVGVLANLRYHGHGPRYSKFTRKILYDINDIEDWVQGHKVITIDSVEERR